MAARLLFLLIGILLKQTLDEFKELMKQRIADLEKERESRAEYRPVPALQKGTAEAHSAILRAQHEQSARPEVEKLTRRIKRNRCVPVAVYAALTIALLIFAPWIT